MSFSTHARETARRSENAAAGGLSWVRLGAGRRYFETEDGAPFLIIGQNDALTWPELEGLLGRATCPAVEKHLAWLAAHGVTTLRVMLEYVGDGLYLERTCGEFDPVTVAAIDDLIPALRAAGVAAPADPVRHLLHLGDVGRSSLQCRPGWALPRSPRPADEGPNWAWRR